VSYVVQRSESLASALYLGALLLLLEAERLGRSPRGAAAFAGALASFVLALGAKPIAITMPAAYLLVTAALAGAPEARRQLTSWSRRAMLILPFVAAAALHGTRTAAALDARAGVGFDLPGLSPWLYLLTEARALAVYVRLLAWPAGQSVDWQFPVSRGLAEPAVLASGAFALTLLAAAAALLVAGRRREGAPGGAARLAGLGLAWWFLVLSVTSSIVPLADTLAEHRVYLASWGLFAATAAGLERLTASLDARRTKAAALVLVAVLCCLAFLTWRRNAVWQTREALWRNVIERNPEHARARLSLGYALAERGRYDDAIVEYEAAVAFAREYPAMQVQALRNLGAAHASAGRRDAAILAYRRGLALAPDEGDLLVNLGAALLASGDPAAAEPPIRRALEVSPSHAVAWNVLGALLLARRDYADALRAFDRAAALNPDFGEFHLNRAATLDALGRREEACAARREALMGRLMPRDRDRAERILSARCN
jgi:tetratricopeptide (TPR) repeat protein